MTIEEIRKRSLEYAKGHVQTGPAWRRPSKRHRRLERHGQGSFVDWFADSLENGKKAGHPPAVSIPQQTNAYLHQDPDDDGSVPW
jgi:hypothetical protein